MTDDGRRPMTGDRRAMIADRRPAPRDRRSAVPTVAPNPVELTLLTLLHLLAYFTCPFQNGFPQEVDPLETRERATSR